MTEDVSDGWGHGICQRGQTQPAANQIASFKNKAAFFLHFVIALLYCKMDPVVAIYSDVHKSKIIRNIVTWFPHLQ